MTRPERDPDLRRDGPRDSDAIPAAPAGGGRAAWRERLATNHPYLYAARHVAIALAEVLVGLVGIGAILFGLLPRLGFPSVSWPGISIPVPDWVRAVGDWRDRVIAVPVGWVRGGVDWVDSLVDAPGWVWPVVQATKVWLPVLIAVLVAIAEVMRRRRAHSEESEEPRDAS
jgi:hypothetical protein